jgi:hypothetical protein
MLRDPGVPKKAQAGGFTLSSARLVTRTDDHDVWRAIRQAPPHVFGPTPPEPRPGYAAGASNFEVRVNPAARPLPATTSAILREASSIISSPSIAEPFLPPASEVW